MCHTHDIIHMLSEKFMVWEFRTCDTHNMPHSTHMVGHTRTSSSTTTTTYITYVTSMDTMLGVMHIIV